MYRLLLVHLVLGIYMVSFGQMGNPLLKLDRDVPATYEYFWSHGMISDEVGLAIMNNCDFEDYTYPSPHNVTEACNSAISQANQIVGDYINNYDVILDVCYPSIVEQELRLKKLVFIFLLQLKDQLTIAVSSNTCDAILFYRLLRLV